MATQYEWDWKKALPLDIWHALVHGGYPTWERSEENPDVPPFVQLTITKGEGRSSRDLAVAFDDIAQANFYYRDWTDSGLPFIKDKESYRSCFWFALRSDRENFLELLRITDILAK